MHFLFSPTIRKSEKNIIFDDKKSQKKKKNDFYENKRLVKIDEIDADKILVSKKEPNGTNKSTKYFLGYNNDDVVRPLCIKLPQMIRYAKCFKIKIIMMIMIKKNNVFQGYL